MQRSRCRFHGLVLTSISDQARRTQFTDCLSGCLDLLVITGIANNPQDKLIERKKSGVLLYNLDKQDRSHLLRIVVPQLRVSPCVTHFS